MRRSSQKKKGLPTRAVSTPNGISEGATAVRAMRSASTSSRAPARPDATTRTRWAGPTTIRIARGRYHGIVYFKGKRDLTLRGDDRKGSVLLGTNNESMNPGTAKRALIGVDDANNVRFENLTIHNLTPQGGTQAEALRMQGCERCSVKGGLLAFELCEVGAVDRRSA